MDFNNFERNESKVGKVVETNGKLSDIRILAKCGRATVSDGIGYLYLYFFKKLLGKEKYNEFKLLEEQTDIKVKGYVFNDTNGIISIRVLQIL